MRDSAVRCHAQRAAVGLLSFVLHFCIRLRYLSLFRLALFACLCAASRVPFFYKLHSISSSSVSSMTVCKRAGILSTF